MTVPMTQLSIIKTKTLNLTAVHENVRKSDRIENVPQRVSLFDSDMTSCA